MISGSIFLENYGTIAKIGESEIKEKDILNYIKIKKCYGIDESKNKALIEIINNNLEQEVLYKEFGLKPKISDFKNEAERIDKSSKAPEIISCIKKSLNDTENYFKLYISPLLINAKLHEKFSLSPSIHKEEINKINEYFNQIENGAKFEKFTEYRRFNILKENDSTPVSQENKIYFNNNLVENVIKNLKPDEIWPKIIEDDHSYQIIRLIKEDKTFYQIDGIIIPKKSSDPWFQNYVKNNIKILILDEKLSKEIKKDFPDLWWLK